MSDFDRFSITGLLAKLRQKNMPPRKEDLHIEIEKERERCAKIAGPIYVLEHPEGAYNENPPIWAQDTFNRNEAYRCGYCGSWMTVVRPGKVQCDTCGDGLEKEWIIRKQIADEIRSSKED